MSHPARPEPRPASSSTGGAAAGVRSVYEHPVHGPAPAAVQPEWAERFPWLVQGTTLARDPSADEDPSPFDLRLFGPAPAGEVLDRWNLLLRARSMPRAVHARQVHGTNAVVHEPGPPGLHVHPAADGHATLHPGLLLTVAVADCVPVFLVDPSRRALAVLHCGWRGTAAGMIRRGLGLLSDRLAVDPGTLHVHLGPAICSSCYEVGPEVHAALGRSMDEAAPIDLRGIIAGRLVDAGVQLGRITRSDLCTRCGRLPLFSHRGGAAGRNVAFLGRRD